MSTFNKEEFLELKSKEQIAAIKKIDDTDLLAELSEATGYKTVKSAIADRITDLKLVEKHKATNQTKDGIVEEEVEEKPKPTKKKKKRPGNAFKWSAYNPPLTPEQKQAILDKYNDDEYED